MGGVTSIQLIKLFRWVLGHLPVKAMDTLREKMIPYYPLGNFKDYEE